MLYFYKFLQTSPFIIPFIDQVFIFTDVMTALILSIATYIYISDMADLEKARCRKITKEEDRQLLQINTSDAVNLSIKVAAFYLLSPYSLFACVAKSTALFTNLIIATMILAASYNKRTTAIVLAAFLSHQSLHSFVLLPPVILVLEHQRVKSLGQSSVKYETSETIWSICVSLVTYALSLVVLFVLSYYLMDESWEFINSTHGLLVTVLDLTPNVGIYWYFFTEVFDHFRLFFLWTFHINCFLYTLPLAVKFRSNPHVFVIVQLILLSIFRPYPSISDWSLYLAMLPIYSHLFKFMKQGLIIGGCIITTSVLAPIMWYMWIITGTANANFYFGVVLGANVGQILLVTDLLFAFTKRDFYLNCGFVLRDKQGNPSKIEMTLTPAAETSQ